MPDALWEEIRPLLPKPQKTHPFGGGWPRVSDRWAMDAIFFVLRTGCHWNALNQTGLCSSSSAHRRLQEWTEVGVVLAMWRKGLTRYDELKEIDWEWQSRDGAMTKAPLYLRERLTGRRIPVRTTERGELCERFAACRVWTVHGDKAVEDWLVMREESAGKYSLPCATRRSTRPCSNWLGGSANATSLSAPTRTANRNWVGTRCGRRSTALGNIISPSPSWLAGSWRRPNSSGPRTTRVTRP
jgi:transposase